MNPHLLEISRRWRNGESASIIADAIPGMTRNAVIGIVHRNDLKRRQGAKHKKKKGGPMPKLTTEQTTEIRLSPETLRALAQRFNVGLGTIWHVRKGMGAYKKSHRQ